MREYSPQWPLSRLRANSSSMVTLIVADYLGFITK